MISLVRSGGNAPLRVLAVALGIAAFSGSSAIAYGGGLQSKGDVDGKVHHAHSGSGYGTLGYGGYGLYPGYQGFGLKFHPGYGYGGHALGVGAFGGYPYYGGPGYPHEAPHLNRFCGISPFPFYGGPGYSYYGHPNFFEDPGQLVVNEPVVQENVVAASGDAGGDRFGYSDTGDYGIFTGMVPYPESFFAPYTTAAGAGGSSSGDRSYNPSVNAPFISNARDFGIDEEPVIDSDGVRAIKVSNVYPGAPAAKAGLQAGDVIRSINGFRTEQPGNLAWIIANATLHSQLKINVHKLSDGKVRSVSVQFP